MESCVLYSWNETTLRWIASPQIVSNSVGILSSLTVIVLVLISRAYKEFIQRLFLYLAITATFLCTSLLSFPIVSLATLNNSTNNYHNKEKLHFQVAISFPLGYFGLVYTFLLFWIGVHVASLTMGTRRSDKSTRCEVIGLAVVTISPLAVAWIFPVVQCMVYDHNTNNSHCNYTQYLVTLTTVIGTPILLSMLVNAFAIGAVVFQLCRSGLKLDIRRSLKKAAPLLAFVVIHQIAAVFLLIYASILDAGWKADSKHNETELQAFLVLSFCFLPFLYLSVLLVLLCQPRVRNSIRTMFKKQQHQSVGVWNQSTGIQDVTSQTHYIVPPETSFTEHDPLIIKQ